ncbi:MAG: hypothetical protein FJ137_18490, partial [Deltaproteobacteria bacterium]|nr:hypothetical protein [Deltaproteobacteria bacterium]
MLAARLDAWWLQTGEIGSGAQRPRPVFTGGVVAGVRFGLTAASGTSVCRSETIGRVVCTRACPEGWKPFFLDAGGQGILGV